MSIAIDQMRSQRDQASQRLEIFVPIIFTSIEIGTTPRRLFDTRLGVSSLTVQSAAGNTGRITIGVDASITPDYGIVLVPGGSIHWEVTLADILQVLGWGGLQNANADRTPSTYNPFRHTRLSIDASQFFAVADVIDQDLTVQFTSLPRY